MIVPAFRLVRTEYVLTAFDGEGARLNGGRWNSVGTPMVYVAGSRSLATLEVLVHAEDVTVLEGRYSIIPIEIPTALIQHVERENLPAGWGLPEPTTETQFFGDRWAQSMASPVLGVPSAVTNEELNYLLNPRHPDFGAIKIGSASVFRLDPRLVDSLK